MQGNIYQLFLNKCLAHLEVHKWYVKNTWKAKLCRKWITAAASMPCPAPHLSPDRCAQDHIEEAPLDKSTYFLNRTTHRIYIAMVHKVHFAYSKHGRSSSPTLVDPASSLQGGVQKAQATLLLKQCKLLLIMSSQLAVLFHHRMDRHYGEEF